MSETDRLADEIRDAIAGDPWYGSPVSALLEGIDAAAAASHPVPGAHSVWELVLHTTGWTRIVAGMVRGELFGIPEGGDWPALDAGDPEAWETAVRALTASHEELALALAEADDETLQKQVEEQEDSLGRPVTIFRTVIGVLQHDAFHAGQIALLRRLLLP